LINLNQLPTKSEGELYNIAKWRRISAVLEILKTAQNTRFLIEIREELQVLFQSEIYVKNIREK